MMKRQAGREQGDMSQKFTNLKKAGDFVDIAIDEAFNIRQIVHYWNAKEKERQETDETMYTVNRLGNKYRVTKNF